MFEFDARRHEYRYAGVVVPGVTSLLEGLHSLQAVPRDVLEAAKKRGSRVHRACELFDLDDLDESSFVQDFPALAGYLAAWKKFTTECRPEWDAIEQPVYHRTQAYAGTPDRFGAIKLGRKTVDDAQVDIKTSVQAHPVWGVQTAAYNEAAGRQLARRFTCQLSQDGTYRLIEWEKPTDWVVFLSLLNVHHWKASHSL